MSHYMIFNRPCLVWPRIMVAFLLALGAIGGTSRGEIVVDFEDLTPTTLYTGPGGGYYWKGPASNAHDEPDPWGGTQRVGTFQSRGVAFVNRYNATYDSWSGFAYSNTTDTTTAGYTNQFSAYAGSGRGPGNDNYGVAFGYLDSLNPNDADQLQKLPWIELPVGYYVQSAYVTNTTYAALSMLNGDSFAKKFGGPSGNDPDWFKLSVYGTDASGTPLGNSVELYLADYRFSNNAQDYIVSEWTLLDLSPLSGARRLYFNLSSSDVGLWGMNTPGYFAIDNLTLSEVPEPSAFVLLCGAGITLAVLVTGRAFYRPRRVHDGIPTEPRFS